MKIIYGTYYCADNDIIIKGKKSLKEKMGYLSLRGEIWTKI